MTLSGLHLPLITPFGPDGAVDAPALDRLARGALADGAAGLVALGTTGEPAALDADERKTVLAVIAAAVADTPGAHLTVGVPAPDTRSAAEALRALPERAPADAALVTVPPFTRPGEAGALAHFTALADASPVPLIVYNIPYRTGQQLSAATLLRLAAHPNIAGVKQAVGGIDADTVALLADRPAEGFAVLAGEDAFAPAMLALGADGGILAAAHLATARHVELITCWRERGDLPRARALGTALARAAAALFAEPNPAVTKGVLHARGLIAGPEVRLPLLAARPESVRDADNRLDDPALR
ncbi:4-hydroxy-tetrahydrodipicolinate synthase [Mangrovactinospora gilvigrisea]|uniref:4-hydroxy-tetrahydrodipicolinate synthase n=1 Tax=Mangrovactinospora gilvigrisea TaxID=1428644 RepID=A0A1J7C8E0_9ACTN|nr:dihydrodipicolinate synthase family protein [Mangrovactinospora gilvigrisea]OIV37796.1 4-hydroxy-tetrahydrodipicolinate synthase [Mangrovactinospora gilvigrisea]